MKILVALDQSKHAEVVLEKAAALAKQQGADVTLITVAEDFHDIGDYLQSSGVSEKLMAAAKNAAEQFKAKAAALGIQAKVVVEQGTSPADLIVRYAGDNKMDLVVLGSRGRTGLDRLFLGSVAAKVATFSPCSVLVAK